MIRSHPRRSGRRPAPAAHAWLAAAAVALAACAEPDPPSDTAGARVVASIFPLADLAALVGGPDVTVDVLVPPRADPSTYEPSPRQMQALAGARAFLLVGGGMDDWMLSVPGAPDEIAVVRVNEGIALRAGGGGEGTGDPHTWLDPVLVRERWLPRIVQALAEARPEAAARIQARATEVADSLAALDGWIAERLAPVRGRSFIATHSAWRYFAERYGVAELGAVYDSPGREPSARELADLLARARAAHVAVVFTEPQLGETAARALAEELGARVELLDPIGGSGLAGRDGYFAMMRFNAEQIARALGASH